MKSELTVRAQGVKGGNAKFENKGCITIYATDRGQSRSDLVIEADSFEGYGKDYKRRDKTLINVTFGNETIFIGTIEQFIEKLSV
jgi:hypothetical protein